MHLVAQWHLKIKHCNNYMIEQDWKGVFSGEHTDSTDKLNSIHTLFNVNLAGDFDVATDDTLEVDNACTDDYGYWHHHPS
jgi:hypothetical protein